GFRSDVLVVTVPAPRLLLRAPAFTSITKHLPTTMLHRPDGIEVEQEVEREQPTPRHTDVVSSAHASDAPIGFPRLDLAEVTRAVPEVVVGQRGDHVVPGGEVVVHRRMVQYREVDCISPRRRGDREAV